MFTWCGILRGDYELDPKFKSFWTCSVRGLGLSYEVAGALKGFQGMCTPRSWTGCQRGPNVPVELISSTSKYQPWLAWPWHPKCQCLWAQPPPTLHTPVAVVIADSRPQRGLWYGQFSFSAPHTWTAASVQEACDWLIWVWPPPGVLPFPRTQGISTKRHMLPLLVSSVCMQQWSSSSSCTHRGHRRAGWSPVRAVRMGCSSLCSCSALGQPASHSEGELLRCVTASRCHEHLIFNSSQGFFSTILPCSPRGRQLAPVSGAHIVCVGCMPDCEG